MNDEKKKYDEYQIPNSIDFGSINYLRICIVGIVLPSPGRERFRSMARYSHRSLLQVPAYLAHTSTVYLSLLYTSRVPNHSRLQSSRLTTPPNCTVPFDSSNSERMLDYCCRILLLMRQDRRSQDTEAVFRLQAKKPLHNEAVFGL